MRKVLFYSIVSIFCVNTAFAQSVHRIDGTEINPQKLAASISALMYKAGVSGLGISIYNNNDPVFSQTFGLANVPEHIALTPSQVMYGASFSKAVFAYIVMQLVQEQVIKLDTPLIRHLTKPCLNTRYPAGNAATWISAMICGMKITERMCLDHTTGFPNWRWFEPDKKLKFKFDPGSRYSYSGEGMYLLQFVIEQITHKDYETIAQERVFIPLKMTQTSYVWHDSHADHLVLGHSKEGKPYDFMRWKEAGCAGTLCTSLDDYSIFFSVLMKHKMLSDDTFLQMTSPQINIRSVKQFGPLALKDSTLNDNIRLSYGLGLGVFKTLMERLFLKRGMTTDGDITVSPTQIKESEL